MSAFDTSTNTGSTTFTNAYATVDLLPSATVQKARGFIRTSGWRYLEMVIDDQGGDSSRLFVGFESPAIPNNPHYLHGGDSRAGSVISNVFNPAYPYDPTAFSLTANTGDVFMFAVDMTGQGRSHDGVQNFTLSGAASLVKFCVEVGKNGVWQGTQLNSYAVPSFGLPMRSGAWAVRDSTSASFARVSLRVVTTSFAYAIPSGMVAWGDGPEGGGSATATYSIAWDPTTIFGSTSLSSSNYVAVFTPHPASISYYQVYSTQLPSLGAGAGMRAIEFQWGQGLTPTYPPVFALIDANTTNGKITHSFASTNSKAYEFSGGTPVFFRGVNKNSSLTGTSVYEWSAASGLSANTSPNMQFVVDHTNQRIWGVHGIDNLAGQINGVWGGAGRNLAALASPYKGGGTDGATITDSVGLRWAILNTSNVTLTQACEINVGQKPYIAYPLMNGVLSYNGSRRVYGSGDTWRTGIASVTYSHSFFGAMTRNANVEHITSSGSKNSGKVFFQVYRKEWAGNGASLNYTTGIRHADMTTLSANAHCKNNLVWQYAATNPLFCRYSVTSTGTFTGYTHIVTMSPQWESVAVDFNLGKIWFGVLDPRTRLNVWSNGGDPAAGTGENMTFTASTTMRVFTYLRGDGTNINRTTVFVSEPGNVVDMPSGFDTWNNTTPEASLTATPSGTVPAGGGRVLWPYGVQT